MSFINFSPLENQPQYFKDAGDAALKGQIDVAIQTIRRSAVIHEQEKGYRNLIRFLLINRKFSEATEIVGQITDLQDRIGYNMRIDEAKGPNNSFMDGRDCYPVGQKGEIKLPKLT